MHTVGSFTLNLMGPMMRLVRSQCGEQLETTDHGHLGQILPTYAAGTDPTTIVWVAPSFRPEHVRHSIG